MESIQNTADTLTEQLRRSGRYTEAKLAEYREAMVNLHLGVFGAAAKLATLTEENEILHVERDAFALGRDIAIAVELLDDDINSSSLN